MTLVTRPSPLMHSASIKALRVDLPGAPLASEIGRGDLLTRLLLGARSPLDSERIKRHSQRSQRGLMSKHILEGHETAVKCLDWCGDSRRLISGSIDCTLRLWDVETGQCTNILRGHTKIILGVAITPDGNLAVSASADRTARVWNVASGQQLHTLAHDAPVSCVDLSPDGRYAVTGSFDKLLRLWDISQGKLLGSLKGHPMEVNCVAYSADGRYLASGDEQGNLKLWDVTKGAELVNYKAHNHNVTSVAYARNGRYVASGSEDSTAKIWDITTGQCLGVYADSAHAQVVYGVDFSPDTAILATGNFNRVIELWDLGRAALWKTFGGAKRGDAANSEGHRYGVNVVKFSPDGKYLASGSDDNTIRIWTIR